MRERATRRRLARRAADLLIIVGGIVLAFPFWSSAYTQVQQRDLGGEYETASAEFTAAAQADTESIQRLKSPAERMRYLAALYGRGLEAGEPLGRLKIPRLGLDCVVIEGAGGAGGLTPASDTSLLRKGPVHYGTTSLPGGGQPFAVAGHRTTYGAPFYHLNELRRGDAIRVETPYGSFRYTIERLTEVTPDDITVLADRGYGLVLTTCTPLYSAKRRLIVWARSSGFEFR